MPHKIKKLLVVLLLPVAIKAGAQTMSLASADALFAAQDYSGAKAMYEKILADTSHNSIEWNRLGFCNYKLGNYDEALGDYKKSAANKPPQGLQPILFSRMAAVYSIKNDKQNALDNLDKATAAGYINFVELDTAKAFLGMRNDDQFKAARQKVYTLAYPCMGDTLRRQFDFWVGDWDAYATGTKQLVGHSVIQQASGGCMILENWTSANLPYSGKSMNFVDAGTNKWQQVWVGAEGGPQHVFVNGEYRDGAMRFDFTTKNAQGKSLKGRFTFFNQGPNQVRQLQETLADDGQTWNTVYDFTYIRKNS